MLHRSSIAAREISLRDLHSDSSMQESRRFSSCLAYNSAEFRQALRHQSVQTEMHRHHAGGNDRCIQVDLLAEGFQTLQDELDQIHTITSDERGKSSDREKLLVAQMNAIRDQQALSRSEDGCFVDVKLTPSSITIGESFLPAEYDEVWIVLSGVEVGEGSQCSRVTTGDTGHITGTEIVLSQMPLVLRVPTSIGLFILTASVHLGSHNGGKYELVIGKCTFPAFVPCIKEKGKSEFHRVPISSIGFLEAELVIT